MKTIQVPEFCNHKGDFVFLKHYTSPKGKIRKGKIYVCLNCGEQKVILWDGSVHIKYTPYEEA